MNDDELDQATTEQLIDALNRRTKVLIVAYQEKNRSPDGEDDPRAEVYRCGSPFDLLGIAAVAHKLVEKDALSEFDRLDEDD